GGGTKDPPKEPPSRGGSVVGTWKGTNFAVEGKKVTFTADGRFYHSAESNKQRTYRVSEDKVEVEFLPGEQEKVEKVAKALGQKTPEKWVYKAKVNGDKLPLNPQAGFGAGNDIPGGPLNQEYKRDSDPVVPKDPPVDPKDPPKDPPM